MGRVTPELSDAVEEYLRSLERARSATTVASYRAELRRFEHFVEGSGRNRLSIGSIDRGMLRSFVVSTITAGQHSVGVTRELSPQTVRRRLVVVRQLLRYAHARGWLDEDLSTSIALPRPVARMPTILDARHLERLLSSLRASTLKEKRDRVLLLMLLSTGARLAEVLSLDRKDLRHNELIIRGSGGRRRTAVLTKRARLAAEAYLDARKDRAPALFIGFQPARSGARTARLTPTGARYICQTVAGRLQLPSFGPRQLRHTVGYLLQANTGDAVLTAETLGLASERSVAVYTTMVHARRRLARRTLERVGL